MGKKPKPPKSSRQGTRWEPGGRLVWDDPTDLIIDNSEAYGEPFNALLPPFGSKDEGDEEA